MNKEDLANILAVDCYRNSNNGGLNDVTGRINLTEHPYNWRPEYSDEPSEEQAHFDYISMCSIYVIDLNLYIPANTKFRRYCFKEKLAEFHMWWRTRSIEIYSGKQHYE